MRCGMEWKRCSMEWKRCGMEWKRCGMVYTDKYTASVHALIGQLPTLHQSLIPVF
jgi:hypothetical protein